MNDRKVPAFLFSSLILLLPLTMKATEGASNDHHEEKGRGHDEKGHGHDDEHETSGKFGEGKAITDVKDDGKAFKISDESRAFLGIRSDTINRKNGSCTVPLASLVYYQSEMGIYTVREGWIELRTVTLLEKNATEARVVCNSFKPDEQIVVSGVGLVRVAHMEALGLGGEGHIH